MNEWEIIGRFVDLDNRLRTLEGRPTVQEKPQPVATLCEAVDSLIELVPQIKCVNIYDVEQFGIRVNAVKEALTAERKRAEDLKGVLSAGAALRAAERTYNPDSVPYQAAVVRFVRALDAFDKGAENG